MIVTSGFIQVILIDMINEAMIQLIEVLTLVIGGSLGIGAYFVFQASDYRD